VREGEGGERGHVITVRGEIWFGYGARYGYLSVFCRDFAWML
jgi:hypothetical protein